jgi:hypothetical protein
MTVDRVASWASFGLAIAVAACGGNGKASTTSSPQTGTPPPCSPCDDSGIAPTTSGGNTNPDGFPYPSPPNGYGRSPRSGPTPGSIMENFKFSGYLNAVVTPQLQRIAMADYYDPCTKRYKVIHLTVGARWCIPCNDETVAIVAAKHQLDSEAVVILQALADGLTRNVGATQSDLDSWIAKHQPTFTEVLDPDPNPMLGAFFNAAAVPWSCDLDPRTMEILGSGTGWSGNLTSTLAPALQAVQSPPTTPLGVTCN